VSTRRISMTLMPLEMLASFSSISSVLLRDGGAGRAVVVGVGGGLRLRMIRSSWRRLQQAGLCLRYAH